MWGVVFISSQNHILHRAFSLTESCFNNVEEYNALLIGLQRAHEIGVRFLEAYGDSKLLLINLKENMRSATEIWYLITMQSSKWLIYLMAFTSVTRPDPKILKLTLWLH